MAGKFEYWTAVFGVGLDGFSDFDHDELNAIAAEGWEPCTMTAVHNGFAVAMLFRREIAPAPAARPAAKTATTAKKAVAKTATPAKAPATKKAAAAKKAR